MVYPVPSAPQPTAYVVYATLGEAMEAVRKLHLHQLHGATMSAALKRREVCSG